MPSTRTASHQEYQESSLFRSGLNRHGGRFMTLFHSFRERLRGRYSRQRHNYSSGFGSFLGPMKITSIDVSMAPL
jgi:hypothetical protein